MIRVAAFYCFARFDDPPALRGPLLERCLAAGARGSILLAPEGVNGTIAANGDGVERVIDHLRSLPGCGGMEWKESRAETLPFARMKVRLKREIVTMGQPGVDPLAGTGRYVDPADWNALISANDVAVIDTRNAYEVAVGSFARAIDPGTRAFGDFPAWWQVNRDRFAGQRIAMFCTGGIRCEKATNYLIGQGVADVFHLKGGILKYLEDVPQAESLWQGQCFVFDQRVSVGHGLEPGDLTLCGGCRRPLRALDRAHPDYEAGVACPTCARDHSDADRARFRERQRQMVLAAKRGLRHLGGPEPDAGRLA